MVTCQDMSGPAILLRHCLSGRHLKFNSCMCESIGYLSSRLIPAYILLGCTLTFPIKLQSFRVYHLHWSPHATSSHVAATKSGDYRDFCQLETPFFMIKLLFDEKMEPSVPKARGNPEMTSNLSGERASVQKSRLVICEMWVVRLI